MFIPDLNLIGEVAGFIAIVNDITHIKVQEEAPLDHHNRKLDSAKLTAFGSMASGLAYQINEPLERMNQKIDAINTSLSTFELEAKIGEMKKQSFRISKILKGLRSFSRSDKEDSIIEHNIAMIFEDAAAFCRDRLISENIKLKIADSKNLTLKCKANQISQVILNLLNNSCDAIAGTNDKWIHITIDEEPHRIQIGIVDSGPELSLEFIEKLKSPFFTTKTENTLSGLRLVHSRGIIESHGGKLFYDSSCANTRFVIELPREQRFVSVK